MDTVKISEHLSQKIIYTLAKDFNDELYKVLDDKAKVGRVAGAIYREISGKEIKFRKPVDPSTRKKKATTPPDDDIEEFTWTPHKQNPDLSYTEDIPLTGGYYPLCKTNTKIVVGALGDKDARQLTKVEKTMLKQKGFTFEE